MSATVASGFLKNAGIRTANMCNVYAYCRLCSLTLSAESSLVWQEVWSVTSAISPPWLTIKTFMGWDTCRPVNTAVFITSQL